MQSSITDIHQLAGKGFTSQKFGHNAMLDNVYGFIKLQGYLVTIKMVLGF